MFEIKGLDPIPRLSTGPRSAGTHKMIFCVDCAAADFIHDFPRQPSETGRQVEAGMEIPKINCDGA